MENKFNKREARVLVYGKEYDYIVVECINRKAVEETVNSLHMPTVYMDNFEKWEDMKKARKCYEWQMSAFPQARKVSKPSDEDDEWFWQKQLDDEHIVYDVKDVVAKWDDKLPDDPNRYSVKFNNDSRR